MICHNSKQLEVFESVFYKILAIDNLFRLTVQRYLAFSTVRYFLILHKAWSLEAAFLHSFLIWLLSFSCLSILTPTNVTSVELSSLFLCTFNPGPFRGCLRIWGQKGPLAKICHPFTVMKLVWVFKGYFNKYGCNFDDISKIGYPRLSWNKVYDVIISVYGVTNKIYSCDSNYIVDVVMWPNFGNSSISMREIVIASIL